MKIAPIINKIFPTKPCDIPLEDMILLTPNQINADLFSQTSQNSIKTFKNMYSREISPRWFKSLSKENYLFLRKKVSNFCNFPYISHGQANELNIYCHYLQKGLENLSLDKPFKFISIGQSPATFAEIMRIKGIDTGICPISGLTQEIKDVKNLVNNSEKYFQYIKNYGVDLENFSNDKNYFFVDYKDTGKSLKNFQKIMEAKGIGGKNIKYLSIQEIIEHSNYPMTAQDLFNDMHYYYLLNQFLKQEYSPIFKLHLNELNYIENIEKQHLGCDANTRCNKLLFYLLDKMIKKN